MMIFRPLESSSEKIFNGVKAKDIAYTLINKLFCTV